MSDLIQANEEHLHKTDLTIRILQFGIILTGIGFTCLLAMAEAAEKWPALVLAGGYIIYLVNERSAFERIRDEIARASAQACQRRCTRRVLSQGLVAGPVTAAFVALFVHSVSDIPAWALALPLGMVCVMDFAAAQVLFKRFDDNPSQTVTE